MVCASQMSHIAWHLGAEQMTLSHFKSLTDLYIIKMIDKLENLI